MTKKLIFALLLFIGCDEYKPQKHRIGTRFYDSMDVVYSSNDTVVYYANSFGTPTYILTVRDTIRLATISRDIISARIGMPK